MHQVLGEVNLGTQGSGWVGYSVLPYLHYLYLIKFNIAGTRYLTKHTQLNHAPRTPATRSPQPAPGCPPCLFTRPSPPPPSLLLSSHWRFPDFPALASRPCTHLFRPSKSGPASLRHLANGPGPSLTSLPPLSSLALPGDGFGAGLSGIDAH
ncbi:hypothetical protein F4802DRAFT_581349 [Xylaria palmicola]|nr:hypothetical protein F4802DRAFT_581349 [Xylaria palmicola]